MLKSISIKNFRTLKKFDYNFAGGITGCTGEMGVGKSTLGYAVLFALTGMTPTLIKKKELVAWGEKKGHVTLTMAIAGKSLVVTREFPGAGARAVFDNLEEVTGTSKVNVLIESIFDCSLENIFKTSLIQQGKLTDCINISSTERQKLYARLVPGLKRADKAIDSISMFTASDLQVYRSRVEEKNELLSANRHTDIDIVDIKKSLSESDIAVKAAKAESDNLSAKVNVSGSITESKLKEALLSCSKSKTETTEYLESSKLTRDKYQGLIDSYGSEVLPANITSVIHAKNGLSVFEDTVAKLEAEKAALVVPVAKNDYAGNAEKVKAIEVEYNDAIKDYTNESSKHAIMLKEIKHAREGKCPTCGVPYKVVDIESMETKATDLYEELVARHTELSKKPEEMKRLNSEAGSEASANKHAEEEFSRSKSSISSKLETAISVVNDAKSLITSPWDTKTVEEIQEAVVSNKNKETNIALLNSLNTQIDTAENNLSIIKANVDSYNSMIVIPDSVIEASNLASNVYIELYADHVKIESELAIKELALKGNKETIAAIELQEKEDRLANEFKIKLQKATSLLGRRSLPLKALKYYMDAVNANVANLLLDFGARFTFRLDDEFNIEVQFGDVVAGPAALSGGQSAMCAVALKMTEIQVFGGNAGFVIADEIGYGLSQGEGFNGLVDMLNRFKSGSGKGMQMVLATHEQALIPTFNHEIQF